MTIKIPSGSARFSGMKVICIKFCLAPLTKTVWSTSTPIVKFRATAKSTAKKTTKTAAAKAPASAAKTAAKGTTEKKSKNDEKVVTAADEAKTQDAAKTEKAPSKKSVKKTESK